VGTKFLNARETECGKLAGHTTGNQLSGLQGWGGHQVGLGHGGNMNNS